MTQTTEELIAKARERLLAIKAAQAAKTAAITASLLARSAANPPPNNEQNSTGNYLVTRTVPALSGWNIDTSRDWNEQQLAGIHAMMAGKSFCLIGAAGTGKTSTLKGAVNSCIANNIIPILQPWEGTKQLRAGKPGIVLCSFTNMAVRQIAKHFSRDVTCCTIHKLLEFAPVYYEVMKPDGTMGKTMRFEPSRNKMNPLPRNLRTIVVDESSMVDTALIQLVIDALPNPSAVQWIFLGDLNQLPPVYGHAILGRKLLELPVIELVTVYRQALLSPIISLAIKMKDGQAIPLAEKQVIDAGEHGKVTINPWSKSIHWEDALAKAQNFCKAAINEGVIDPFKDIILCPFNVNFGVQELNRSIADWMGRQRKAVVTEVIAGFNTHYYAIGDKVLVAKREAIITAISRNREYYGKKPVDPVKYEMDRWGGATLRKVADSELIIDANTGLPEGETNDDIDALLASLSATHTVVEDRKNNASHKITVRFINGTDPTKWTDDDDYEKDETVEYWTLETAAEVNEMLFAYAITVHKSQGSEWRKVLFILHSSHSQMCSRELLYTGITRAAQELIIICEPDRGMKAGTLTKAANSPRLKGNTLAEKLTALSEKFEKEAAEQQRTDEEEEIV